MHRLLRTDLDVARPFVDGALEDDLVNGVSVGEELDLDQTRVAHACDRSSGSEPTSECRTEVQIPALPLSSR